MNSELDFVPLTVDYQSEIDKRLFGTDTVSCDYCLASILLFTEMKELKVAKDDIALYIKGLYHDEDIFFSPLCKEEDFNKAIYRLREYSHINDIVLRFYATKEHVISLLKDEKYSDEQISSFLENKNFRTDNFCFENDRASAEYVYTPSKLINLSGSHYKSKRNEIHKFCEEYQGKYELKPYNDDDLKGVLELVKEWSKAKEFSTIDEPARLKFILENREKLRIDACVLKVDGEIVATSIYSIISSNVGDEIFERCKPQFRSAYPLIAKTVAGYLANCRYINFEEDLGLEGLRFSKMSYVPDFLIEKYIVCENNEVKLKKIYREIFGDGEKFTEQIFGELNQCSNTAMITDKGKVVSSIYFRNKTLSVANKHNDYPFIYALGTDDNYRHQGLAKSVTKRLLNMINDQNYGFVGLYPFPVKRVFYEKMDFITFNYTRKKKINKILLPNTVIKQTTSPNINDYTLLFNNSFKKFNLSQSRDNFDTALMIEETNAYNGLFTEFYYNNTLYGYVITSKEEGIEESIFDFEFIKNNKTNDKLTFDNKYSDILNMEVSVFVKHNFSNPSKNDIPYTMIRPVNKFLFVKSFLNVISTNKNYNVNLFITDEFIGNSIINLVVENKTANVHAFPNEEKQNIYLTTLDLANWCFGIKNIEGLPKIKKKALSTAFSDTY